MLVKKNPSGLDLLRPLHLWSLAAYLVIICWVLQSGHTLFGCDNLDSVEAESKLFFFFFF